jgi:hypothetical protein
MGALIKGPVNDSLGGVKVEKSGGRSTE